MRPQSANSFIKPDIHFFPVGFKIVLPGDKSFSIGKPYESYNCEIEIFVEVKT